MNADPDRACPHENFTAAVTVDRIIDDTDQTVMTGCYAAITVSCADCGEPFRWTGLDAGLSATQPRCSPDETELRAPIRPASADPDFGMGLPGYAIRYRGGPG